MRRMRLAFLCFSRSWGGLESNLLSLASRFSHRGHHVHLVAPPDSPLANKAASLNLPLFLLSPTFRYLDPVAAWKVIRFLSASNVELLLATQSHDLSVCALASHVLPRLKLVFLQQMQFGLRKKDIYHRWAYGRLSRWITLTRQMKMSVLENTTVTNDKIVVIPNGVDLTTFDPSRYSRSEARTSFGLPFDKTIVAVVGRLDRQKGQEYFIRSLPRLCSDRKNIHAVVVGEETRGEEGFAEHLRALVDELGLRHCVTFLPYTERIPEFLTAIDTLVLPSFAETFGLVLIEAMAMEKPVIATNAGGVPEIIRHEENGLLVEPRSSEAIAKALDRLLANPSFASALASKARATVQRSFDAARQVARIEQTCYEVLESP